jgi:2-polyprenyl-6-methoxyphenol hydroxylase-like FAD-dependent oxidoreductase
VSGISRVLIVGAGIGGLTLATALGRRGIFADVVEKNPQSAVLGVGIIQPANALRALQSIGLADDCLKAGFPTDNWRYFEADGEPLTSFQSLRLAGPELPAYSQLPRAELHRILTKHAVEADAKIRMGVTVTSFLEVNDGIDVTCSDGTASGYDLLVGADGIRSQIRRTLFPEFADPVYTGLGCWRVTLPRLPELTYQAMYFSVGTKAGLIPLSDDLMYLLLVTPEPGNPRFDNADFPRLLRERLVDYTGLDAVRSQIEDDSFIVYTPIEEVALPDPWYAGRALLIGDAAHASGPHLAQGATMAIEDAVVLGELAAGGSPVTSVLPAFMRRRYDRCRFVQTTSHKIGELGSLTDPAEVRARNEAFRNIVPGTPREHEERLAQPI